MFNSLSDKLESTFRKLRGRGALSEVDIDEAMKEIRMALLEADVNFKVVKSFCESLRKKALGQKVLKSLSPGQMVIKLVHDELIAVMGVHEKVNLSIHRRSLLCLLVFRELEKQTTCGSWQNT